MEDLISSMSNLIYHIAKKFTNDTDLINELYNQGVIGVYDAYTNYDKKSNTKFSSYAYMYIYGKMYSYMNENRNIKLNKEVLKTYKLILKSKDYLCQINYRDVSYKEVADYLNMDDAYVNLIINIANETLSLDYEYDESSFGDYISYDDLNIKSEIKDMLDELSAEERKVIYYKYFSGYSQSEIAKLMNMSQSGVSRCEKSSIEKLRVRSQV